MRRFQPSPMLLSRDKRQLFWPIAIASLIFFASSRPRLASPDVADVDKLGHFLAFGLLATLVVRLGTGWRAAAWALLLASGFGATDEWHQAYVPGRAPDVFDWIADTLGAALAVTLYAGWPAYRRLLESPLGRSPTASPAATRT